MDRIGDGLDQLPVNDIAGGGSIQIDDVYARSSERLPLKSYFQRVFIEDGFPVVIALIKADAFTVPQVYGRNDFDGFLLLNYIIIDYHPLKLLRASWVLAMTERGYNYIIIGSKHSIIEKFVKCKVSALKTLLQFVFLFLCQNI